MKRLLSILFALLMLANISISQENKWGVIFTFHGFSNLSVGDVAGGAGLRYHLTPSTDLRGTLGFTSGEEASTVAASGAVLFNLATNGKTSAYLAPEFTYFHVDNSKDLYSFGLNLGVDYQAWDNITLGAEYGLAITGSDGKSSFSFGHTNGMISLTCWL